MKILTAGEMREVDRLTTERYSVPSILLMENAAARTVEAMADHLGGIAGLSALVICGRGNNGGDGAAVARQLYLRGASALVLLLGRLEDARGDARTNFEIARALAAVAGPRLRFIEIESAEQMEREAASGAFDLLIDAIFGTGLTRPASG
ncbi:MAG TPA: NAD(P)H-hydrate epimerase, partial [Blastocatellia bacterium]|nr:NAD(P)H-hydrate epimerase [Blastocatellia bacterium]